MNVKAAKPTEAEDAGGVRTVEVGENGFFDVEAIQVTKAVQVVKDVRSTKSAEAAKAVEVAKAEKNKEAVYAVKDEEAADDLNGV
jgi:hypothetical protein